MSSDRRKVNITLCPECSEKVVQYPGCPPPIMLASREVMALVDLITGLADPRKRRAKFRQRLAEEWVVKLLQAEVEAWTAARPAIEERLKRIREAGRPKRAGGEP